MGLNSCLYEMAIRHARVRPKHHHFRHNIFMFYIDLDELPVLSQKFFWFGWNRFRSYAFWDKDHLAPDHQPVKQKILDYLKQQGVELTDGRIMLLTHLRALGHIFNPVSFYFCFDRQNNPVCVVPEIGNTFGEMKPFILKQETLQKQTFVDQQQKYFYISPFSDLRVWMDFRLTVPQDRLQIHIDDFDADGPLLYASMIGQRAALTTRKILWFTLIYPWITVKTIALIHWHALILWLKKVPFHRKKDNPQWQKERSRVKK